MDDIQSLNRKYGTIESILTKCGKVNSRVTGNPFFRKLDIYNEIMRMSSSLDIFKDVKLCDRIAFISKNMSLKKCQFCNKPYIYFGNSLRLYRLCGHHFNVNRTNLSTSLRESKNKKRARLLDSLSDENMHMDNASFELRLNHVFNLPNNYNFPIMDDTFDFLHDVIIRTKDLIPVDNCDLRFSERIFILFNGLKNIPKCKFCNSNVNFRGRRIGYSTTCTSHKSLLGNAGRTEKCIGTLLASIDRNKYDVIQTPCRLSLDLLVVRCRRCGKESSWAVKNGMLGHIAKKHLCRFCEQSHSVGEESVYEMLKRCYDGEIVFKVGSRTIIPPYELDIYIPDKKLAIEYDGIYWHSEINGQKQPRYHLTKTGLCEDKGIQLIHIFETEWLTKQNIVESRLKNMLGIYDKTIYARKCTIRNVPSREATVFIDDNHMQGACNASVRIGLYYENELISIMTFSKPRFRKNSCEWELVRFCSKLGYHIPGAASKLLKFFETGYSPKNIVSYADRRWSSGRLYKALGFDLTTCSKPNYWYFKPSAQATELISRVRCQKHRLKKMLDNFDESKTEFENMVANGYDRIFDCGNFVFVKTYANEKTEK